MRACVQQGAGVQRSRLLAKTPHQSAAAVLIWRVLRDRASIAAAASLCMTPMRLRHATRLASSSLRFAAGIHQGSSSRTSNPCDSYSALPPSLTSST